MENLFYAPSEDWDYDHRVEIKGQEALHIVKVLRHNAGDIIEVADGKGRRSNCEIEEVSRQSVFARIKDVSTVAEPTAKKVIAFGAIKKRDRLEFAVEKAVELDAWELCIFNADHSERSRLNRKRLDAIIISAFKQSRRRFIPKLLLKDSLDEVFDHYPRFQPVMAHEEAESEKRPQKLTERSLLLVGPEGGFSDRELELNKKKEGEVVSLGKNRLRAETAVAALLSQFLFSGNSG